MIYRSFLNESTTIPYILQSILTPEEVEIVVKGLGYVDKAR
ncbi:cleavage/polyadenylation specificity factor Clipper subunit, partial [Paenibacillus popilliae ATCC 14706]